MRYTSSSANKRSSGLKGWVTGVPFFWIYQPEDWSWSFHDIFPDNQMFAIAGHPLRKEKICSRKRRNFKNRYDKLLVFMFLPYFMIVAHYSFFPALTLGPNWRIFSLKWLKRIFIMPNATRQNKLFDSSLVNEAAECVWSFDGLKPKFLLSIEVPRIMIT